MRMLNRNTTFAKIFGTHLEPKKQKVKQEFL